MSISRVVPIRPSESRSWKDFDNDPCPLALYLRRVLAWILLGCVPVGGSSLYAVGQSGDSTLKGLVYDLSSPDAPRRRAAVEVLGEKQVVSAIPELITLWEDPDVDVRRNLVKAFGRIGDRRADEALARMLEDTDREVRYAAVRTLASLYIDKSSDDNVGGLMMTGGSGNPLSDERNFVVIEPGVAVYQGVVPSLAERLKDDDKNIRKDSAKALGVLRGVGAVPKMTEALKSEKDRDVLVSLIRAFYKIGDRRACPELILFAYHDDKQVHDEAIFTLGMLRCTEAVADLTKIYQSDTTEYRTLFKIIPVSGPDDLRWNAFDALARIASPESRDILLDGLSASDERYRQAGAEGLARLGDKDQLTLVSRRRIRETKETVRLAQSFALFRLGRREYIEDFVRGIEEGRDAQAFAYMLELKEREIPLLYPYLKSSHAKTRAYVAEVLGLIDGEQALSRLDPLSRDADATVLASAVRAIRRINARANRTPKH